MRMRTATTFLGGALITGTVLALGALAAGGSAGATLASGRAVSARSDSWYLSCNCSDDSATIKTAGRTILIAPGELQIDGRKLATLSAAARSVDVTVRGRAITFVADGKTVATCPR